MKANFQCSKCFEYHTNIEITKLNSFLKNYTHFAECPNKKQAVFVNLKTNEHNK